MKCGGRTLGLGLAAVLGGALLLGIVAPAAASTNVLVMPDRPALIGTPVVIWGNTKFPNGSAFQWDFGDGTTSAIAAVSDRTYIATTYTYTRLGGGSFTARLTVWNCAPATAPNCASESETAIIIAIDPAVASAEDLRSVKINMAIESALRWIYVNQSDRTSSPTTAWARDRNNLAYTNSYTSLAVLALENHGHLVTSDPTKDIYRDVVQRGLNFIFDNLNTVGLGAQSGGDPCVNVPDDGNRCTGLAPTAAGYSGYTTSIAALAVAASNAPSRIVDAGLGFGASWGPGNGGFVAGRTYGEILQRQLNTLVWGLADAPNFEQGGIRYNLNDQDSDGSALGWAMLAFLDGTAAGATVPNWVANDVAVNVANNITADGSLRYNPGWCGTQAGCGSVLRTGVILQALKFLKTPSSDSRVTNAVSYLGAHWNNNRVSGENFDCSGYNNKNCAYAMFQAFKGLKLYGVATIPGVGRAAGPGAIAADDWYEDYRDYLVANQQSPSDPNGGGWGWYFSCCDTDYRGITALSALILSPTPLVLPCCLALGTTDATGNLTGAPVTRETGTARTQTVTAVATTAGGGATPATTVTFTVLSGPNAGQTANAVTNDSGVATFTIVDSGGVGTDSVRANVGGLASNTLQITWTPADLRLTTQAPSIVPVNTNITYTLTVTNAGPVDATGVTLTDTLPAGVTFVSVTPSAGSCVAGPPVSCALGTIANTASVTVTLVATATAMGPVVNTATVASANGLDLNLADNTSTVTVISAAIDLQVTTTASADFVLPGNTLTYTETVRNLGPGDATAVVVTDTLPAGTTFVSATPSAGGACSGTGPITCTFAGLANGASATVTVVVQAVTRGSITNTVTATATEPDLNSSNNTASTTGTVASADLVLVATAPPVAVGTGGTITYDFVVRNQGPDTATNVVLTDTRPSSTGIVSMTASQGNCTPGAVITCALGSIASGGSAHVVLTVQAPVPGDRTNVATVTATEPDPDTGNNGATAVTAVGDIPPGRFDASLACPALAAPGAHLAIPVTLTNTTMVPAQITRGMLIGHFGEFSVSGPNAFAAALTVPGATLAPGSCSGCTLTIVPSVVRTTVNVTVPGVTSRKELMNVVVTYLGLRGNATKRSELATVRCVIEAGP